MIDSVVFSLGAFWKVLPNDELLQVILTTYLFKLIVSVMDTPFIYLARILKKSMNEK